MEPDSSALKEEIARLYAIIDALIAHNKVLQAKISCLKNGNAPPDSFSSHVNFEKGNIDVFSSPDKIEKGSIQPDNSNEKTNIGRNDAYSAYDTIIKGSKGVFSSHEKIETGRTGSWNHLSKTDTGRNDALRPLPDFVEPTPAALGKLAHLLNASGGDKGEAHAAGCCLGKGHL